MKILVVEPHPDDAFLSLGDHLERKWKGEERTILTVFHDDRRGKEAEAYAGTVGAEWVGLGLPEAKMLSGERPRRIPELVRWTEERAGDYDTVVFPLGLQHPDHLSVAASRVPGALRYFDTPYQGKLKLADALTGRAEGMVVRSVVFPPKRKWRHVPIFKSQAKFFYFNENLTENRLPEIIVAESPG